MRPLICDYLKTHSFRELEEDHGVCTRFSSDRSKVSANYDQLLIKNGDRLAEQCRGIIIRPWMSFGVDDDLRERIVGEVEVLAWPMDRFYNHGDAACAAVDWDDRKLSVFEKLDGTMIVLYWDDRKSRWFAATRSVPEADLPISNGLLMTGDETFSSLFFKALIATRETNEGKKIVFAPRCPGEVVKLNKELTYIFELTTPHNRIVVKYDEPRVTLIAARHTASGRELAIDDLWLAHVGRPKTWDLRNVSAIQELVGSADPVELEGVVVCDSQFRRVKLKNAAWVLSSRAKDAVSTSRRNALEIIILGKVDDVIPLVNADVAELLNDMRDRLHEYVLNVDARFRDLFARHGESRKSFALALKETGEWMSPYFELLDKKSPTTLTWLVKRAENGELSTTMLDTLLEKIGHAS